MIQLKNKRITIRFWLYATAISTFVLILLIGFITNYYVRKAFSYYELTETVSRISQTELVLRKNEKNFIQYETSNSSYFASNRSEYLTEFDMYYQQMRQDIDALKKNKLIKQLGKDQTMLLADIGSDLKSYYNYFQKIVTLSNQKGFKDYGLVGQMREAIHQVESTLPQINNKQFSVNMLMLRRHEKDYLLRKDLKYKEKFNDRLIDFVKQIEQSNLNNIQKQRLIELLINYKQNFFKVIELDIQIGLNEQLGLFQALNTETQKIEKNIEIIKTEIEEASSYKIDEAITIMLIVSIVFTFSIILLLLRQANHIVKSIKHIQNYITQLGKGELPDDFIAEKNDEIAEMVESVNVLTQNLKNTKRFAIEVGKGNLDTNINVFNNKGDLGGSLIGMRNQLAKVAREREANELDTANRTWINVGRAELTNVLREHYDSLDIFSFEVINNLCQFLEVEQATIYLTEQIQQSQPVLELHATLAVDKNQIKTTITDLNDSLVGAAVTQKKIITLNNLPNTYLKISSSLGYTATNNLMIIPLMFQENVVGVIELGAIRQFTNRDKEFAEKISKDIGATISSVKNNHQRSILLARTQQQAEELLVQKEEILSQKNLLDSSIRYSQSIQNSFLPSQAEIGRSFPQHFILFMPRNMVSGDFYWFAQINDKNTNQKKQVVAVVDCTGHGVPGAFMSIIGSNLLNEIVIQNHITDPAMVLELMDSKLIATLKQEGDNTNTDGMDLSIVVVEKAENGTSKLTFGGAKQNLYFFKRNSTDIEIIKGDRRSIGGAQRKRTHIDFNNSELTLSRGDSFYLLSDGIIDQNNAERKKFGSKRLLKNLLEIQALPMPEQKQILHETIEAYQVGTSQRDDITIFGIRLS